MCEENGIPETSGIGIGTGIGSATAASLTQWDRYHAVMEEPKGLMPSTAAGHGDGDDRRLPLFTYGTLLDEVFMEQLLEHPVWFEPARLQGYRTELLEVFGWPILVLAEGETVDGRLYRDLNPEDFRRLDAYEGVGEGLYVRVVATALAGEDGGEEQAFAYVPTERTLTRGRSK
jgi:gamma-glutamylcyclotransferase (GGCT)/AIG2-like uncharacterized protein YtfP